MSDSHSASTSPADDEPDTPFWLPAVGFVLFILGGLAWAVTPPIAQASAPVVAASASAAEPPPPPAGNPIQRAVPAAPTSTAGMFAASAPPRGALPPGAASAGRDRGTRPNKATLPKPGKKQP